MKPIFIKLTTDVNKREIYFNISNIMGFYSRNEDNHTLIDFGSGNYFEVKEDPDKILELIREAMYETS